MSIVVNGSGTITGISTGGLPDGSVDVDTLAANSVTAAKIVDGTIVDAEVTSLAASKLTGALPAISGASLTNLPADATKLSLTGGTMTGVLTVNAGGNLGFQANGTAYTQIWQTLQSPNDLILKTTADKYMAFQTNSAEKMRIGSNGNVGIGTTTLNAKLNLSGGGVAIAWLDTQGSSKNWALRAGHDSVGDFAIRQSNSTGGDPVSAGTTALIFNASRNATFAGDVNCESVQGGDYTTSAGTISISCGSWGNMIQLSALDAGYLYYGDAYLPGYEHGTYHASFLIQSNTVNADVTYITQGAYQHVRVNSGWIQTKEVASGGSPSHYMKLRKLAKDT